MTHGDKTSYGKKGRRRHIDDEMQIDDIYLQIDNLKEITFFTVFPV